jgi:hypothetical protein
MVGAPVTGFVLATTLTEFHLPAVVLKVADE